MGRHPWFWVPSAPRGEEGGDERWLITYADMITLLLVLFIILYSMANMDLEKFQALAESLRDGFGATESRRAGQGASSPVFDTSGGGTTPLELFPENQTPIEIFDFAQMMEGGGAEGTEAGMLAELQGMVEEAVEAAGREGIDTTGMGADIQIEYNERGIRIIIFPDQILFESGAARLRPEFKEILSRLYNPLSRLSNRIEIQGHTDNIPIRTATFPSNWELSAGRAGAVIRYFESKGMPPSRLQAAGYADTIPRAENTTRKGRSMNRRVEILVLREVAASVANWRDEIMNPKAPEIVATESSTSDEADSSAGVMDGSDAAVYVPEGEELKDDSGSH